MKTSPPPVILLVTTDQQRFDASSGAGPSFLRTPHVDDLRRQGICFSRCYSTSPICGPARTSILTGQHVMRHGRWHNEMAAPCIGHDGTLPDAMRRLGYQTVAVGKMHWHPQRCRHGFEEMILPQDYYRYMARHHGDLQPMRHGMGQNELYPALSTVPEPLTMTSWLSEQALQYIRERRDPTRPLFMWLSYTKPHPPLDPPKPYYTMYRDADIPQPFLGDWADSEHLPQIMHRFRTRLLSDQMDRDLIRAARAAYYGLITQIDYNLGRVLSALQDEKLLDQSLILYTSDHGEFLGDHRMTRKIFFHEPSAHVPMIVRPPRDWGIAPGTICPHVCALEDIMPTCTRAAGGDPVGADGIDLLSLLSATDQVTDRLVVGTCGKPDARIHLSITDGRWKYCYYPHDGVTQLFDLEQDPNELRDLCIEQPAHEQARRLRRALIEKATAWNSPMVDRGRLRTADLPDISDAALRAQWTAGYATPWTDLDNMH